MTINGFSSFASSYVQKMEVYYNQLEGKRITIDLLLFLFQIRSIALKEIVNVNNVLGDFVTATNHLCKKRLFERLMILIQNRCSLIFCIDMKNSPLRVKVQKKREEKNSNRKNEIEQILMNPLSIHLPRLVQLICQDVSFGMSDLLEDVIVTLKDFGFPVVSPEMIFNEPEFSIIPPDGEGLGATLCAIGAADIIVTNDADAHIYGATWCLLKFEKNTIIIRSTESLLNDIASKTGVRISLFHLQIASILAGVDFNDNIRGMAFGKALKEVCNASQRVDDNRFMFEITNIQLVTYINQLMSEEEFKQPMFEWKKFSNYICMKQDELEWFKAYYSGISPSEVVNEACQYASSSPILTLLKMLSEDCIDFIHVYSIFRYVNSTIRTKKIEDFKFNREAFNLNGYNILKEFSLEYMVNFFMN